jgi:hypothetical protein
VPKLLAVSVAAVAAAIVVQAAASTPPVKDAFVGATHAQPVAGTLFTGITVTPAAGAKIHRVSCNAKIGLTVLQARQLRYFTLGIAGPAAVTCGWQLPADSGGKLLTVHTVRVVFGIGNFQSSGTFSWRIR